MTRKRVLVEFDANDQVPGATLTALVELDGTLEQLKHDNVVRDYGIQIEDPHTWIVTLTAQDKRHPGGPVAAAQAKLESLRAQGERDKTMRKYYKPMGEEDREETGTATADTGYP